VRKKGLTLVELIIVILIIAGLLFILICGLDRVRSISPRMVCGTNISGLGKAMLIYSNEFDGKYPTAERWCDLLVEHADVTERQFICYGALRGGDEGRCHYALNPGTGGTRRGGWRRSLVRQFGRGIWRC